MTSNSIQPHKGIAKTIFIVQNTLTKLTPEPLPEMNAITEMSAINEATTISTINIG